MGKQLDRLYRERLKEYYKKAFEEFKNMLVVDIMLIDKQKQFAIDLLNNLNESEALKKLNKNRVPHPEFDEVREEAPKLNEEYKMKARGLTKNGKILDYEKIKAEFFEQRLDLIEQELDKLGIIVKIVDGIVKFKDKNHQKDS